MQHVGARATDSTARSAIGRAAQAARNSCVGAVSRLGGRAFGVGTIGYDVVEGVQDWQDDSYGDAAAHAASAAGTVFMLSGFPPLQVVGGVMVAGATVYELREEIGTAARWVGDATTDAAGAVAGVATDAAGVVVGAAADAVDAVGDTVGGAVDAVGDLAGGVGDFVADLF